jgi:hypothetical protein
MWSIEHQESNGGAANGGATDNRSSFQAKVMAPLMAPWIEQASEPAIDRIKRSDVRPFVLVVRQARKGTIRHQRLSAMLLGDDVIDLERRRAASPWHAAVFTPVSCAV